MAIEKRARIWVTIDASHKHLPNKFATRIRLLVIRSGQIIALDPCPDIRGERDAMSSGGRSGFNGAGFATGKDFN
jgi:hypothetical protein